MSIVKRRQILQGLGGAIAALTVSPIIARSPWGMRAIAQASPRKLALLIGINQYSPPIAPLRGCVNDVELQARLLRDRYGFLPEDIVMLTDEEATRQGIVEAIEHHLVQQAQPGDVVVVHFSGHAAAVADPTCALADCSMGVLIPTDGRFQPQLLRGNRMPSEVENGITRTDLETLLSPLATEKLTVVLDTDGAGGFAGAKGFAKGVLLAGSTADQLAAEMDIEGFPAGAFTYELTQHLWQQSGDASVAEVMDRVAEATRLQSETSRLLQTPLWIAQPESDVGQQPIYFVAPTGTGDENLVS